MAPARGIEPRSTLVNSQPAHLAPLQEQNSKHRHTTVSTI